MRAELVDRLSSMLNFNLKQLAGPKCNDLKVKNPTKYGWEPRSLLAQIFDIYLHLDCDRFAQALAADERSFDLQICNEAASRIKRLGIRSVVEVERFKALTQRAHEIYGMCLEIRSPYLSFLNWIILVRVHLQFPTNRLKMSAPMRPMSLRTH